MSLNWCRRFLHLAPLAAGLSGESFHATQASLRAPYCNPRWVQTVSFLVPASCKRFERSADRGAKLGKCNPCESSKAALATKKLSPDSPAACGERSDRASD